MNINEALFAISIRLHFTSAIQQRLMQNTVRFSLLQFQLILWANSHFLVLKLLKLFALKKIRLLLTPLA